jgi:capsular polysaccharide transport system ATP-binding protein
MISLRHVYKTYHSRGLSQVVARDLSFDFPVCGAMGLLGRNGAGKSSLLHMLAGILRPDRGQIVRRGSVSWPVGFQGSFHPDMTGVQNARFVARLYGVDTDRLVGFVADFTDLGPHFNMPVRSYSSGMRARLAFGVSMAVPFDTYLIDEVTSVGDGAFRTRSEEMLQERMEGAAAIVVSHSMEMLSRLCRSGAVLENGRLFYYARIERAIEHHNHLMQGKLPPWMR